MASGDMTKDEYLLLQEIVIALNRLVESVAIISDIAARKDREDLELGEPPIGD
jgi:hypothetical protein